MPFSRKITKKKSATGAARGRPRKSRGSGRPKVGAGVAAKRRILSKASTSKVVLEEETRDDDVPMHVIANVEVIEYAESSNSSTDFQVSSVSMTDPKLTTLRPVVVLIDCMEGAVQQPHLGRPLKKKKGPAPSIENSHLKAQAKYNISHPDIHRTAVKNYATNNPSINRQSVSQYTRSRPDVSRESSRRHRDAVKSHQSSQFTGHLDHFTSLTSFTLANRSLLGPNCFRCPHCNSRLFEEERRRKQWCCGEGRNVLLTLPSIDEQSFYSDKRFNKYANALNNVFAFSAIDFSHGGFRHPKSGLAFTKIQGRMYHKISNLAFNQSLAFLIVDGGEHNYLQADRYYSKEILVEIAQYLKSVNPFLDSFKRLSLEPSADAHVVFECTSRKTHGNILGDMPRGNEVAAFMRTDREQYDPRNIVVWKMGDTQPQKIDLFHPLYEAFQYPLLYPHGSAGWTLNTLDNRGNKLSQLKYYRCLMLSYDRFSFLGRLSQTWLVDMYCRIEEERLRFVQHQQTRRSAPADEIRNVTAQVADDETIQGEGGVVPGKIYLPNTFTGGPRYMQKRYMDAIAVVNRLGRPSYFLTITCNPKWQEIVQATPPSAFAASPAICARVFNLKLQELLRDLRSGAWFGKKTYIMHVIEFQKRGLPHAHICFRVEGGGPVQNTEIDKVIRADIPAAEEDGGRLRELVLSHMVHGPCGHGHRLDLPCWDAQRGVCSKNFPKLECDVTHVDNRGFIHLKRNANNRGVVRYRNKNVEVNDLWVVPYNAPLLIKYDCHINLEVASTRKIVKYLFKYLTKGPDEARVAIASKNEVQEYVTKRYIGACDAAWRLFEFDLTSLEPNVFQLPVHLENQHHVIFQQGRELDALATSCSYLTKYFNRPPGVEFDGLTYIDFYETYIVHTARPTKSSVTVHEICDGKYFVTRRQRKESVARLFWVAPNRGEQFYLRILLTTRPCRSYGDLLMLGGANCSTFQEAARALGLVDDEDEYVKALREAATFLTGPALRRFFVLLITNGAPAALLWDRFRDVISEEIIEQVPPHLAREGAYDYALLHIDRLLRKHGSRLSDHGLPDVCDTTTEYSRERAEYMPAFDRLNSFLDNWLPRLSQEQRQFFDHVKNLLNKRDENLQNAIFLDGPSGTGKTLLLNTIVAHVRAVMKGVAICVASSGIAALNYEGGMTAHSMFRFPLDLVDDKGYWGLTNGTERAELIRESSIIIYDEAPMAHKFLFSMLDRSLRDLMGSNKPFGGKIIILAGDFRQIPPVVPRMACSGDILNASILTCPIWSQLFKFSLACAQRTRDDPEYSDFLLRLGSGQCDTITSGSGRKGLNLVSIPHVNVTTDLTELINYVFPPNVLRDPDASARRAILTTLNVNVRQVNSAILDRIDSDIIHCYSVDYVESELAQEFHLGPDTLNRVQNAGVPDHDLTLKIGCVCLIVRNLSFTDKLVNGTKVIVVSVSPRLITVRKPGESELFAIPRITFKTKIEPGSPIEMTRRQFPLQVSYSMTIHKSQGQTIDRVGVDLRSDVFAHGQLYVALGRVRSRDSILILIPQSRLIRNVPHVHNVTIPQLLCFR